MGGQPKGLLDVPSEGPTLARMARVSEQAGLHPVLAVVGYRAAEHRTRLGALPLRWVEHPGWAGGRTSSVQAGLRALGADPPDCVLWPVDAPFVRASTLQRLRTLSETDPDPARWLVPVFQGRRGHPVLLGPGAQHEVLGYPVDRPLSSYRTDHPEAVREVLVDDPGVGDNLDSPEAFRGALQRFQKERTD